MLTFLKAVRNQISEAQKIAGGNGSEQDIAEAKIELEVCLHIYSSKTTNTDNDACIGSGESSSSNEVIYGS